jgi:2-polyprenyl-3-methyl-5-hydroxy-6-metoxy-1,4-benzoquinol methylase
MEPDARYFSSCLLCNSDHLLPLKGYEKDFLTCCQSCSFVFSTSIPTHSELLAEYSKYSRSNLISAITIDRYKDLLLFFEKQRVNNTIIDIGAGDGHFIGLAQQNNWKAYATEFDDTSVKLCQEKGVTVHKGKLDAKQYAPNYFDVIYSSEVIEHINNPVEEIENFHHILREGGLVYVTTPNFNALSRRILKHKWNIFNYPEHLSYYTPKTLTKLFTEHGFRKVQIQTTGISPARFLKSLNTRQANGSGNDEALRENIENKFWLRWLKYILNALLNFTKSGDAMKGVFIKVPLRPPSAKI